MVQLVIEDSAIPKFDTVNDVPEMNPGSIVYVREIGEYFIEDGS
jgi:hypothetical protein